jgi:hypothetical protein
MIFWQAASIDERRVLLASQRQSARRASTFAQDIRPVSVEIIMLTTRLLMEVASRRTAKCLYR